MPVLVGWERGLGVSVNGRSVARRFDRVLVRSRARSGVVVLGRLCVPNRPESVALARRLVVLVAEACGVGHVGETAALLVSELTTNAQIHAQGAGGGGVEVVVSRRDDRLRVEVRDGSPLLPVARSFGAMDENGRGLFLVEELADGHGADRVPGGKAVWFELVAWDEMAGSRQDPERDASDGRRSDAGGGGEWFSVEQPVRRVKGFHLIGRF